MNTYPLFDTGFTFWLADLDSHLRRTRGVELRQLGVSERELMARYHSGASPFRTSDDLTTVRAAE
ncbi:MAG: hypothetical protein ACM31L_03730 [Actinomycetota bacterium]